MTPNKNRVVQGPPGPVHELQSPKLPTTYLNTKLELNFVQTENMCVCDNENSVLLCFV